MRKIAIIALLLVFIAASAGTAAADPAPSITTISPNVGSTLGGTTVTITGTTFNTGITVTFDGTAATSVTRYNSTKLTVTSPSHINGSVDVVVKNTDNKFGTKKNGFTYNKESQTITFNPLGDQTYGAAPFTVSATGGGSGNPVTFSTTSTTCSVSGTTVTITGLGSCTITANQAGNSYYDAASPVSSTFVIDEPNPPTPELSPFILTSAGIVGLVLITRRYRK